MEGNNLVIFVSGKAFSGKDTLAKRLRLRIFQYLTGTYVNFEEATEFVKTGRSKRINEFELGNQVVYQFPFADEVKKELCRKNLDVDFDRLMTDSEYKEQYRKELVDIGDGYRMDNPFIWIDYHKKNLIKFLNTNDKKVAIITDMRYQNEFNYFENLAMSKSPNVFISVRINASLPIRLSRMTRNGMLNYVNRARYNASETELDDEKSFDMVINNDNDHIANCMSEQVELLFNIWRKIFS